MSEYLKINNFYDLEAWKQGHILVLFVYRTTKNFPKEEMFGLVSQMRRAAVSVTSNIAEGFSRRGLKEKMQFYLIAGGSLTELHNQTIIAKDVGYIGMDEFEKICHQITTTHKILNGLISKTNQFLKDNHTSSF